MRDRWSLALVPTRRGKKRVDPRYVQVKKEEHRPPGTAPLLFRVRIFRRFVKVPRAPLSLSLSSTLRRSLFFLSDFNLHSVTPEIPLPAGAAFGPTTGGKMWVVSWNRKGEKSGRELDNDNVNRGEGTSRFGQLNEWKETRSFSIILIHPRGATTFPTKYDSRSWFVIDHSLICPAADVLHNSESLITFVESWDESRTDYGVSGTISTPKEFACGFENSRDCYPFHFDLPLDSREER